MKKSSNRSNMRIIAVKNIYQMLVNNQSIDSVLAEYEHADDLVVEISRGVSENLEMLKLEISKHLRPGWTISRLYYIDQAILLVAVYELLFTNLDKRIVINEAVEIAKKYCDDNNYKFINGVLDKVE